MGVGGSIGRGEEESGGRKRYHRDLLPIDAIMPRHAGGRILGRANDGTGPAGRTSLRVPEVDSLQPAGRSRKECRVMDVADEIHDREHIRTAECCRRSLKRTVERVQAKPPRVERQEHMLPEKSERPDLTVGRQANHILPEPPIGGKQMAVHPIHEQHVFVLVFELFERLDQTRGEPMQASAALPWDQLEKI